MRKLLVAAFLIFGFFCAPAHAQNITRLCNQVVSANGNISCQDGWSQNPQAALTNTVVQIKNVAGFLGAFHCYNPNGVVSYVQVFDAATSASVTLGTTSPSAAFGIGPSASADFSVSPLGLQYRNGIQVAGTTTASGASAPSTALVCTFAYE